MHPHLLRLIVSIAPPQLRVVLGIRAHAQQIQAVQLVKHLDADAVPRLARLRVCDLHGVGGFLQLGEVGFRDHLVGNCGVLKYEGEMGRGGLSTVCDVHPCVLDVVGYADVFGGVEGVGELELHGRVFDFVHCGGLEFVSLCLSWKMSSLRTENAELVHQLRRVVA
jgi:hypothetical protein